MKHDQAQLDASYRLRQCRLAGILDLHKYLAPPGTEYWSGGLEPGGMTSPGLMSGLGSSMMGYGRSGGVLAWFFSLPALIFPLGFMDLLIFNEVWLLR